MEDNERRFNTYREKTTENEEDDSNGEESSISNESSLIKKESREDLKDNETDEKDVSKEQDVIKELTSIGVKSELIRFTRNRKEFMTSIIDMFSNTNVITLKTVYPDSFRGKTIKTRIFIL